MILLKKQAGLLRSVRSWGALGLVLALVVLPGISNQAMPIEQALDQNHNGFLDDSEMLQALNLWVQQSPVPGTENAVIDDLKILELLQLWIKQTPIGQPPSEKWVMFWLVSTNQIARIRPDGTSREILFPNPGFEPSPSRDGQWLTYTKLVGDPPAKDVFVRGPDGTEVNLTNTPGVDEFAPVWSWDEQMVAFVRRTDAREDIFKVNRDGSGLVRLTNNPATDHVPIWHPDNHTVVFMSDRDGNPELYKVDINNPEPQGGPVTRLTNDPGFDAPGALASDGSTLFWHSNRTGRWDIFKMAWDNPEAQGGPVGNLTNTPDQDEFVFNFGFDQTELTFQVHTETDNPEIWVMRAQDGSNKRKLSDDAARPQAVEPPRQPPRQQGECECEKVEVKRSKYWQNTKPDPDVKLVTTYKDDGVPNGQIRGYHASFDHKIKCTDGPSNKKCSSTVRWELKLDPDPDKKPQFKQAQVTGSKLNGPNFGDLEVKISPVEPEEVQMEAACGTSKSLQKILRFTVWIKLPEIWAGEFPKDGVVSMKITIPVRWKAVCDCPEPNKTIFEESETIEGTLTVQRYKQGQLGIFLSKEKGYSPSLPGSSPDDFYDDDGDGWTNLEEKWAGTDPKDKNSKPEGKPSIKPQKKP